MSIAKIIKNDECENTEGFMKDYTYIKGNANLYNIFMKDNEPVRLAMCLGGKIHTIFITEEAAKDGGLEPYYKDENIINSDKIIYLYEKKELDVNNKDAIIANNKFNELKSQASCVIDAMNIARPDLNDGTIDYMIQFGYWYNEDDKKYGMVIINDKDHNKGVYLEFCQDDVNNKTIYDKMKSLFYDIVIENNRIGISFSYKYYIQEKIKENYYYIFRKLIAYIKMRENKS